MLDLVEVVQRLIRIDTSNPPGNELPAIGYLQGVLEEAGVETTILAADPARPNLVARIPGTGDAPGLLLHGHVDVVPTTGQQWQHDPFGGEVIEGWLWGRGTLDMKAGVVMMIDAFLRKAAAQQAPAGDIMLALLSDEEQGGALGAKYLVQHHADQFAGVSYAIGEFGAFPLQLGGQRFYPVQIAERVGVVFTLSIRGPAGHGSLPVRGGATARLGEVLTRLDRRRLPVHLIPATRLMLESMAEHVDGATRLALRRLLDPRSAAPTLRLLRAQLGILEPLLRNTVNATIVHGGDKHNVIPAEVTVILDGRMLPGFTPEDMAAELQDLVGAGVEITYESEGLPRHPEPDMTLFPLLAEILEERDPQGVAIPFMLPAVTDGRWFAQLGIQHYGFLPMKLPDDFAFQNVVHAEDERIPVDSLRHGADALAEVLDRYPG